ncbi:MAG: DsbA family oxidoreductase [Solirubrobacterales bacterium]
MPEPRAILFGDLNCPFCWAVEERLIELGLDGEVEWRGAAHAPHLPVPPQAPPGGDAGLAAEVRAIGQLAPELGVAEPQAKPSSALAIRTVAATERSVPGSADQLRMELQRALWREGADISSAETIERIANSIGVEPTEIEELDEATVAAWQAQWLRTGVSAVPALLREDLEVLVGLVETERLAEFLAPRPGATG